jgi:hypothetical protein
MAFSDWDFFENGGATESLQTTGALVDSSSLEVILTSSDRWQAQLDSGQSRGFTVGKIRTLMKVTAVSSAPNTFVGLFCMTESEDVTAISQDLYMVAANPNNIAANLKLKKLNNGITDFSGESTKGSTQVDFTTGNLISLEMEWQLDVAEIGGIFITIRTGTATDFSDLSDVITYIDPSPYTSTFAEGLAIQTVTSTATVLFDETTIFEGS